MYKVYICIVARIFEELAVIERFKLIPAHMRNYKVRFINFIYTALYDSKSVTFLKFIAFFKHHLHTETYSEKRLFP